MEKQEVITTSLTFDYFKADKSARLARCIHTETVDVFGWTHEDCFIETENGREVRPELEAIIYPLIKHEKYCRKSNYHTVSWDEHKYPLDWFEKSGFVDEEDDELYTENE